MVDSWFARVGGQLNNNNARIAELTLERNELSSINDQLRNVKVSLVAAANEFERRARVVGQNLPLFENDRVSAAKGLAREVMISYAKDEALDGAKGAVEDLVGASGITSLIPTDAEDAVVKAAQAGRRVLIPHSGYKAQWDAFFRVQQQTSTLVERTQDYVLEAARLCAHGSPEELSQHIKRVFGHLSNELAEYTLKVGLADLPAEEEGVLEKAMRKYLDARKAQE